LEEKMERIENFPHSVQVAGDTIKMEKNRIYKTWADGSTGSMAVTSNVIGVAVSEPCEEYVIVLESVDGYHVMSRLQGWFGPYAEIKDIAFDDAKKVASVVGKKGDSEGSFPLVRE
jgi:hypothetical protein